MAGKPLRVLLREDSADTADLLRELRGAGYDPTCERADTAGATEAALDRQRWDVVIGGDSGPQPDPAPHRMAVAQIEAMTRLAARLNAQLDLEAVLSAVCEETARARCPICHR